MRAETGPMQFPDDWPGVFIRGDNAAHYAMAIEAVLGAVAGGNMNNAAASLVALSGLRKLLLETSGRQCQQARLNFPEVQR